MCHMIELYSETHVHYGLVCACHAMGACVLFTKQLDLYAIFVHDSNYDHIMALHGGHNRQMKYQLIALLIRASWAYLWHYSTNII